MKLIKKLFLILCVTFFNIHSNDLYQHRKLIIIIDFLNEDKTQGEKFFNDNVIAPGPEGTLLRNALHDEIAPIVVSKNIFQTYYNFSVFSQAMIEKNITYLEKKYGKNPTEEAGDTMKNLHTLVHFLLQQYGEAKDFINTLLDGKEIKKDSIIEKSLDHLAGQSLSLEDYAQLGKKLKTSEHLSHLAQYIISYYMIFNEHHWDIYTTQNNTIILFPKKYPIQDFNTQKLYIQQAKVAPLEPIQFENLHEALTIMKYEGRLFVYDIEQLINNMPFEKRKPLDIFMVGHGVIQKKLFHQNAGLLAEDFQRLVATFGRSNTHSLFYLTCHGGGITAKKIWFKNKHIKNTADNTYQSPFITIISPATELPFNIFSPFWITAWVMTITKPKLGASLLKKDIDPYIPVPNLKKYFELIPQSIPKALEQGLYQPLQIPYGDQKSILSSQIALIKIPGTEWFSPQFYKDKVFEITKTRSARACAEHVAIKQPRSKEIIALSARAIFAPLIIHQTENLRILSLLSQDSSYQNTASHFTTYLKKVIIQDSTYESPLDILKHLSITNIAPCSVIPTPADDKQNEVEIKKDFVIDEIENSNGKIIAKKFTITPHGTFFVTKNNELHYFNSIESNITNQISQELEASFHDTYNSAKKTIENDENKEDKSGRSQTVTHKINAMKNIQHVLADKLLKIRKEEQRIKRDKEVVSENY
jgi:CRISPR/Cas system-associated exonuclease Cas4 (RecB family)